MNTYGPLKNGTDEPICRAGIKMQTQKKDLSQQGKKRVGRIESVILKHMLQYVKQIASGQLPYNTGSSTQGSVTFQRGKCGGGDREFQE